MPSDRFPCDVRLEAGPCPGKATHVYRSASATRLVCDGCATAYRSTSRGAAKPALVEFSLLELIPARAHLLGQIEVGKDEKEKLTMARDRLETALERSAAMARVHQDGRQTVRWWCAWADVGVLVAAIGAHILWGGMVGPLVFGGGALLASPLVEFIVWRWCTRPAIQAINEGAEGIQ